MIGRVIFFSGFSIVLSLHWELKREFWYVNDEFTVWESLLDISEKECE